MPAPDNFKPHKIQWTRELISRFWDFASSHSAHRAMYFSRLKGDALIGFVRSRGVKLSGRVLDFGCGPGYLLEKLIAGGTACEGLDFSRASLEEARGRLGSNPLLKGLEHAQSLPVPYKDETFDVVFALETVEHLLDADLEATLADILRITRPGGAVVVTTPNQEDLEQEESMCPECGSVFHRWQHIRSFDAPGLSSFLSGFGLREEVCRAVHLPGPGVLGRARSWATTLFGWKPPQLVYIGRKEG